MDKTYDLITIGAGGGAYPAAFYFAKRGLKTLMVDKKGKMSGNCLEQGCVPSKTLREYVNSYYKALRFGLDPKNLSYEEAINIKNKVQHFRYTQHEEELREYQNYITLLKGEGILVSQDEIEVDQTKFKARMGIIIASGSESFIPPIEGKEHAITSKDIYIIDDCIKRAPSSIAIIGAGYIGIETAFILKAFGTKVYILEMFDSILPGIDKEISHNLFSLIKKDFEFLMEVKIKKIEKINNVKKVYFETKEKEEKTIEVEEVMFATGRKPAFPKGTKEIGIEFDKKINVNEALETSVKGIYASGDVNTKSPLFHAALTQSLICANNILNNNIPTEFFDERAIVTSIFSFPPVSYIGFLKEKLEKKRDRLYRI